VESHGVDFLMVKEKNAEMDQHKIMMEKLIKDRYKRPLWDQTKDAIGVFFLAITMLISTVLIIGIIVFLIVTLIEHPVSLTILCGTILLLWMWGNR